MTTVDENVCQLKVTKIWLSDKNYITDRVMIHEIFNVHSF